jgi:hypothetical protein
MSLIFQIILTVIGAFLSVVLTRFLVQNGRAIEANGRAIAELGKKLDERTAKIAELIVAEGEKTRELIKSLSEKKAN